MKKLLFILFLNGCSFPSIGHKHTFQVWECDWLKAPCTKSGELKTCCSECAYCDDGVMCKVEKKRGDFTPNKDSCDPFK